MIDDKIIEKQPPLLLVTAARTMKLISRWIKQFRLVEVLATMTRDDARLWAAEDAKVDLTLKSTVHYIVRSLVDAV